MPAEPAYVQNMTQLMTAEDLLQPHVPKHAQLVRGVLVVREPPGFRHGEITPRLTSALMMHVDAHTLGRVVAGDAGFKLQSHPDTVRGADCVSPRGGQGSRHRERRSPESERVSSFCVHVQFRRDASVFQRHIVEESELLGPSNVGILGVDEERRRRVAGNAQIRPQRIPVVVEQMPRIDRPARR